MAVVLPGKFIFLAQPHTGSSAMVLGLQDAFPEALDLRPHHMTLADVRGQPGAARMTQISRSRTRIWDTRPQKATSDVSPDVVRQYLTGKEHVFTVIRNPYDFLATCFVRRGRGLSFKAFLLSYNESPYLEDGRMYYHTEDCDSVLRWEDLPRCLDDLMANLGVAKPVLGQHNVTKDKKPWIEYYGPEEFEVVNRRFGEECSVYYAPQHT